MKADPSEVCFCGHERGWHVRGAHECHQGSCDCDRFGEVTLSHSVDTEGEVVEIETTVARAPSSAFPTTPSMPVGIHLLMEECRPTCQRCGTEVQMVGVDRDASMDAIRIIVECHGERETMMLTTNEIEELTDDELRARLRSHWSFSTIPREERGETEWSGR